MTVGTGTDSPPRMIPELREHNRAFWTDGGGTELRVPRCRSCSRWTYPHFADCPWCGGDLESTPVSGRGEVFTFTVNAHPFHPAVPPPYVVAIVTLDEQDDLRIATNIVGCDPDEVEVGMPVEVRFEPHETDGETAYFPVFTPVG